MNIIFGTDGWRGLVDSEVNEQSLKLIAQAFADYLKKIFRNEGIKVAIGYDGRQNSKLLGEIFAAVLSGNNILVSLSNKIIPTPVLSFFVKTNSFDAGVMITASHNPANYNGIKFKGDYGGPFFTEQTAEVEKLLGRNKIKSNENKINRQDFLQTYINHIKKLIDFNAIKSSKLKVLIDSMSGAGQTIIEDILSKEGIEARTIYGKAETDFSGRSAEPIEKNLLPLKKELQRDSSYSIGLATDGDADRLGVMLENGEWLSAQEAILLLVDYVVNQKKISGHIVKTSSVTDKIKQFETEKRSVIDVQVGFKYICEKMISENIAVGCEESGGYGFANHIPERDGILSALFMIEMLAKSGSKNLSGYVNSRRIQFGKIFYDRIDYYYDKDNRMQKLPQLALSLPTTLCDFKVKKVLTFYSSRNEINGLKFMLEGNPLVANDPLSGKPRWLLLRASETEPMFRIYSEGESEKEVTDLLGEGVSLITT
ncbi:MAG: phosphoglucomutase [Bacteroidetes bacterium]|nr:phosphoglucomutase [Bacteroidota bacterium]MBU2586140.1 phosphoglucomutase [Bacteroidota bacterium]